jgi:hypothetical protein
MSNKKQPTHVQLQLQQHQHPSAAATATATIRLDKVFLIVQIYISGICMVIMLYQAL